MARRLSLLYSQLGYYDQGEKQAFFRALPLIPAAEAEGQAFRLFNEQGESVYQGVIRHWGELWRSRWWVMDFSDFGKEGAYYLEACGEKSEKFLIGPHVLSMQGLRTIALEQLDERVEPGVGGWRDCGSKIRETSSMVITVHALCDLWENPQMLPFDRDKLMADILIGGNALVSAQESWPEDPLKDGRFNHDAFRMTDYGTTDYHNWHDTAYAITGLVRAWQASRLYRPAEAARFLACAEKAFENAMRRPYALDSDFTTRDHPAIAYQDDFGDFVHHLGRLVYHKPAGWKIPKTLRTKDKLTFAFACTLMYDATGERRYLDAAVDFADSACARQCLDGERHPEGFGYFYEFEDDDEAFMLEFGHNHKWHMGNIEPCNVKGLMRLVELMPGHGKAAAYQRAILAYTQGYVKRVASLTPLSIYPQSVYPSCGGVKFFEMVVHGFTCLYGQIAHHLMELSDFLEDETLARLAERNLAFCVGRNPGFPDAYTPREWQCMSLIKGVGSRSFGGVHSLSEIPDGSAMNGFATRQFDSETPLEEMPDEPLGIWQEEGKLWFNEDYLPHSHGYVSGVAKRERPFALHIRCMDGDTPEAARLRLRWEDGGEEELACGPDGRLAFETGQMYRRGEIALSRDDCFYRREIVTLPDGQVSLKLDIGCLLKLSAREKDGRLYITVRNTGARPVERRLHLGMAGVVLDRDDILVSLKPGEERETELELKRLPGEGAYLVNCLGGGEEKLPQVLLFGISACKNAAAK